MSNQKCRIYFSFWKSRMPQLSIGMKAIFSTRDFMTVGLMPHPTINHKEYQTSSVAQSSVQPSQTGA